jgi:N-methylhydantoinase B/oxoprolinase/acetone carboxylase alpha subunit
VEAGSNTSTVAPRVVGGDEKELSALGCNWATLFLGDIYIYTGPGPPGWGNLECETVKWDSDPKMTALARANSNCKRQTHPLVREDVT